MQRFRRNRNDLPGAVTRHVGVGGAAVRRGALVDGGGGSRDLGQQEKERANVQARSELGAARLNRSNLHIEPTSLLLSSRRTK